MIKNAIVTGGSRGIGKAIAMALAKEGVNVALTYNTNREKACSIVKEIESKGNKAICIQLDQKSRDNIRKMIRYFNK